jgi:hypothetical protein
MLQEIMSDKPISESESQAILAKCNLSKNVELE